MSAAIKDRAHQEARTFLRRVPGPQIARTFGVHPCRPRHWRTDEQDNPPTGWAERIMGAETDDEARQYLAIGIAAWERRVLLDRETPVLLSRWHYLYFDHEHALEAEENKASVGREGHDEALEQEGMVQIEMAALRRELIYRGVPEDRLYSRPEVVK